MGDYDYRLDLLTDHDVCLEAAVQGGRLLKGSWASILSGPRCGSEGKWVWEWSGRPSAEDAVFRAREYLKDVLGEDRASLARIEIHGWPDVESVTIAPGDEHSSQENEMASSKKKSSQTEQSSRKPDPKPPAPPQAKPKPDEVAVLKSQLERTERTLRECRDIAQKAKEEARQLRVQLAAARRPAPSEFDGLVVRARALVTAVMPEPANPNKMTIVGREGMVETICKICGITL